MRRDLLGLRPFVIILCATVAGGVAQAEAGMNAGITAGLAVALGLHTLVGK